MRTSRGVLRGRSRRATLASLLPWRGAFTRWHSLEWGTQKPITILRPQLCSWNARRELYQDVGNFVGSVLSPILANVYLHYAVDLWFEKVVKPSCRGEACLIRYADDFVCAFERQPEAERFYTMLGQRLGKFGLELSAEKTRVIPFSRQPPAPKTSFEFLGF
ncbi:MAG TPA: reverse transcriptase domain-containing protein, partial [Candidatus Tectomicrobia bacterium]